LLQADANLEQIHLELLRAAIRQTQHFESDHLDD
jgi:hypothetical protein